MYITKKTEVTHEVLELQVSANVRYWEDATINGVEDKEGTLTPLRDGEQWMPVINLASGKIKDWPAGTEAKIHFKVCDAGVYSLIDTDGDIAVSKDGYVPSCLCPLDNGHGDYIILDIDENGFIDGWMADLSDFEDDED